MHGPALENPQTLAAARSFTINTSSATASTNAPAAFGSSVGAWAAAIIVTIVGNAGLIMQPLLVGQYVDKLGLTVSQSGYVSSVELAGLALSAILASRSIDRVSLRVLGAAGCLVFALANLASAHASGLGEILAVRIFAGAGGGVAMAVGSAFAARTSQPERVFGLAFAGVTAYAYGFLVNAAALIEAFGPAGIFYVKIALGVCAAAVAAVSVSSPRPSSGGVAQDEGVASGLRASFSDRFRILACGFLLYVGHAAVWTYEERMGVNIGMTGAQVGQALGLASIASFVASLLAAALGTKFGRTWPQFLALGASVAAAAFIVESGSSFAFTTSACLIGIAWFYGVPYLAGVAAAADSTGKTASLLAAVMTTGYAVGPFAAASIIGATFKPVGWFAAVLYIACAVLVIPSSRRVAAIRRVPTY